MRRPSFIFIKYARRDIRISLAPLAYTKTYAVAAAAVLSITLVPILMAWFIRGHIPPEHKNPLNRLLAALYAPLIRMVLSAPRLILVAGLLLTLTILYPLSRLGSQFMPPLNEGTLLYMPVFQNPAVSIGEVGQVFAQTDRILKTFPEVKTVFGQAGRAQTATDQAPLPMFDTTVTLRRRSRWPAGMTLHGLQDAMTRALDIPGLSIVWTQPIKNRVDMVTTGLTTPLGIKIAGPRLSNLERLGQRIQAALQKVRGTQSAYASRVTGGRYIIVHTERTRAARYGLSVADVNQLVETVIGGTTVTTAVHGLRRFPVVLRYPRRLRQSLAALAASRVAAPGGAQVPLGQVARIRIESGPLMLTSDDGHLSSWVYIDLAPGTRITRYVARARRAIARSGALPTGYTVSWVGEYKVMRRADRRLELVVPALLLYFTFRRGRRWESFC